MDDVLWAADPEYEYVLTDRLFKFFELNGIEEGEFRFCGREHSQGDDFSVYVTCKHNTEKVLPIKLERSGRSPEDKASQGEIAQARSVIGSLAWIARQVRPDLCVQCNKILAEAIASSNTRFLKSGVFSFEDSLLLSIHDASWADE